jgi:hypothetical protein
MNEGFMDLSNALNIVYGHSNWSNPIRPYFVSGITQTPYEAYKKLKVELREIVVRLIGHEPAKDEGDG